jgi:NAD(P)H-quinone oxidoreductase subunit 5
MLWFIESYGFLILHALLLGSLVCVKSRWRWQIAEATMGINLLIALSLLGLIFLSHDTNSSNVWLRTNGLSLTVMVLISFIGWIVLRYARRNLAGDSDNARFLLWYLATILAVSVTISTNHLVIFGLAWASISLSLNQLLLFYPERPRAALAAHKKFLSARLSESMLLGAFTLLFYQHNSVDISFILSHYHADMTISKIDQFAALLIAMVALIKCAQLPLHGWLIQVVEAPTPVSALLHAGIINLGGFLLLLFSPLLSVTPIAQWLLLIVAGISTVIATLIMMTRISIKVRLAWSTIAQMGLMLIECALGLYELALLHLIAHSCYKAHAFLASGDAVNHYLRQQYVGAKFPSIKCWMASLFCVGSVAGLIIALSGWPTLISPWLLITVALTSLLAYHFSASSSTTKSYQKLQAIILALVGVFFYTIFAFLISKFVTHSPQQFSSAADIWVSLLFVVMFSVFLMLQNGAHFKTQRNWFIALNAGFYIDEWATRVTLKLWPIPLPKTQGKFFDQQQQPFNIKANPSANKIEEQL